MNIFKRSLFLWLLLFTGVVICDDQEASDTESDSIELTPEQSHQEVIVRITRSPRILNFRKFFLHGE